MFGECWVGAGMAEGCSTIAAADGGRARLFT
jgi:hypothetical protein